MANVGDIIEFVDTSGDMFKLSEGVVTRIEDGDNNHPNVEVLTIDGRILHLPMYRVRVTESDSGTRVKLDANNPNVTFKIRHKGVGK